MFHVNKPEWRRTVTTVKRLLEVSLTYKNAEKQVSIKAKMERNISPFSYFPIIKIFFLIKKLQLFPVFPL